MTGAAPAPRRSRGSSLRRTAGQPARPTRSSTSAARSGCRGARTSARSGSSASAARWASSTAVSSPRCVLPATQTRWRGRSPRSRRHRSIVPGESGAGSFLMFPVTKTRSGSAPSAMIRRASSCDCMAKILTSARIARIRPRTSRYRRQDRSEMRPFAIMTGTPRAANARSALGQSSVSMHTNSAGSSARTARRIAHGRSSGKKRWAATVPNRSRTTRAPVSVTVVITSGSSGWRRRRPSTSGAAAIASPTDTAWSQTERRPSARGSSAPSRARARTGTPCTSHRPRASGR